MLRLAAITLVAAGVLLVFWQFYPVTSLFSLKFFLHNAGNLALGQLLKQVCGFK